MSTPHQLRLLELTSAIMACRSGCPNLQARARLLQKQILLDIAQADFAASCAPPADPVAPEVVFRLTLFRVPNSPPAYALFGERRGDGLTWVVSSLAHAVAAVPAFVARLLTPARFRFGGLS